MVTAVSDSVPPLVIRLFGGFQAQVHGAALPPLRSRTAQWLLALLMLRHETPVERAWLAATFWPDSSQAQSLSNLRRNLVDLRDALGPEAHRLLSPTPRTLRLNLSEADCDWLSFDAAIARGDHASLQTAIALYRGPLLQSCPKDWVLPERELREQRYLQALETLAQHGLEHQDVTAAIRHLRLALLAEPLRESVVCKLMQALAQQGDMAAVTQVYRDFRLYLHAELNAAPAAETVALYRHLREQSRGALPVLRASGERNTPGTAPRPSAHLPIPLTPLIGREAEITEVIGCLETARLVTLTGTGGVGKTRLAIAVEEAVTANYPDGVWLVDFAPLNDPSLVAQSVASALQVREIPGQPLLETLTEYLRARHLLLLLDNCEHLIEACSTLAEALLSRCPDLQILATSRRSLGLRGEVAWRVPSLSLPDPNAPISGEKDMTNLLLEYEAIRLFVAQARAVAPRFRFHARNQRAVMDICQRVSGIPLALELAAARVRALPVEQITARLAEHFDLLAGGSVGVLPRQQTLRATLDWSYALLTEQEKALLRRLAVFAGGWTLEGAEAVCAEGRQSEGGEDAAVALPSQRILDLLTGLVDASLVVYDEQPDGTGRYHLLETTRQYALEKLQASGEEARLRGRHQSWYLALVEKAEPHLSGPAQKLWLDRLEQDHANLNAALQWAHDSKPEAALQMANALAWFWMNGNYYTEGEMWLEGILSRNTQAAPRLRAETLWAVANLAQGHDIMRAGSLAEESLALARIANDPRCMARALSMLGVAVLWQGDTARAAVLVEEGLPLSREIGEPWPLAFSLSAKGWLAAGQHDFEQAVTLFEESVEIGRQAKDNRSLSFVLYFLAGLTFLRGDMAATRAHAQEGLTLAQEIGFHHGIAHALEMLGRILVVESDLIAAHSHLATSLTMLQERGKPQCCAHNLEGFAYLALAEAQPHRAVCLLGAADAVLTTSQTFLMPTERVRQDSTLTAARVVLSAKAFAAAWAEGQAMTLEQAVSYALEKTGVVAPAGK
jgi:predicted ATPase/DNA-binding SARP family transcriptional activator